MLSLPKALLFGSQSKIDFKLSTHHGIARLYSERHIAYHDSNYWCRFLQLDTPSDVFSLLSLADLRRARTHAPENLVTLVSLMVAHLESLLLDPLFEPPPTRASGLGQHGLAARLNRFADVSKWSVPAASFVALDSAHNSAATIHRDRAKEALNAVRILTRTLPAVMECDHSAFENDVLWSHAPQAHARNTAPLLDARESDTCAQFVIDDQDEHHHAANAATPTAQQNDDAVDHPLMDHPLNSSATPDEKPHEHADDESTPVTLGERLVRLTVDLLFCSGFTLPWTHEQLEDATATTQPRRINYAIWVAGVGSSVDVPATTHSHVSNRVEVLRLLLVVLSKSVYIPASKQSSVVDPALEFCVQHLDRRTMLPLLCSLINTSITNAPNSTSAWLGLPSVAALLPGSNHDVHTSLVTMSLQILDVLLTYDAPLPRDADTPSVNSVAPPLNRPGAPNVFRFYLTKLHRTADFHFIWSGIAKSFNQHVSSTIHILAIPIPTAAQPRRAAEASWQLSQVAERLVLLWQLLEHNPKFRVYVLDDAQRAPELLTILLYFSLTYKDNLALHGLVRLCAFMLHDISSQPAFATNLAKPGSAARVQLPSRLGLLAANTAIDFLVQAVYLLIATTKSQLSSLYAPLLICLTNTAPAWRSLSITASSRVVHLLRSFSQPSFLLQDQAHPRLLFYVLETINAVLTFGYSANVNLVYSLILAKGLFDGLEAFSLRRGVEAVWKRRRALGTDTRDWFQNAPRLEKPPLPPTPTSTQSPPASTPHNLVQEPHEQPAQPKPPTAIDKGKMRRISTSSTDLRTEPCAEWQGEWQGELSKYPLHVVEHAAAQYIGKNGFGATQAWVDSWHQGLPLSTARFVIDTLLPDVERIAAGGGVKTGSINNNVEITAADTDARVLAFLREQPMSQYLAPPEAGFHARGWQWTDQATVWLRSYLWGTVYVSALLPFGLWNDTEVRLFRIHERVDARRSSSSLSSSSPPASQAPSTTQPVTSS